MAHTVERQLRNAIEHAYITGWQLNQDVGRTVCEDEPLDERTIEETRRRLLFLQNRTADALAALAKVEKKQAKRLTSATPSVS